MLFLILPEFNQIMTRASAKQKNQSLWSVKEPWNERERLARELNVPTLVTQLLYNRGIDNAPEARSFLKPNLGNLIDPEKLIGIKKAVGRIRKALSDKEKIVIYGDYDVDGVAGLSILWQCFMVAGHDVEFYVPHRLDEGYGLNIEAIRQLADKGAKLIITVDCGVSANQAADEAAALGVDLIITDHHKIEGEPAPAVAVVHPNLPGQDYENHNLCGAGAAFKLAWALAQEFSGKKKVSDEFRQFLISATSLAALGTVADVVPLTGENRIIASYGIQAIRNSANNGLKALLTAAGLDNAQLNSVDLAYKLAPRLNAAGRMGHARLAVELFTRSSPARAEEIANYLESQNRLRQKVEKEITEEALGQVKALGMDSDDTYGIVLAGENWHAGVIGIVASRIVDVYHRPTIIISIADDKGMGSCRSIKGFDIYKALQGCGEHLIKFGGHAMAAGLTVEPNKIADLRKAFDDYAGLLLTKDDVVKKMNIDAEVSINQLDLPALNAVGMLGPFGAGNPSVRLVARNLKLVGAPRRIGAKGDHLAMTVTDSANSNPQMRPGAMMRAVAFGMGKLEKKLIDADSFDLAFEPTINRFNGNETVEMMVKDIIIR